MKHTIFVELFEEHEAVNFYTIRSQGAEESEVEDFLTQFDTEENEDDINIILAAIDKIGEIGAKENRFRPEGGRLKAIPLTTSQLRLYIYHLSEEVVLIGNGGLKNTRTFQESPELNKKVSILREVGNKLMISIKNNKTQLYKRKLTGNLKFYINTTENEKES